MAKRFSDMKPSCTTYEERHWNKMTNAKTLNFWNDDSEMSMGEISMMTISDRFGFQE